MRRSQEDVIQTAALHRLKVISDGMPELKQDLTSSGGSIPSPMEHEPCQRIVSGAFRVCDVPTAVLQHNSRIWGEIPPHLDYLPYSTKSTIVGFVNIFLKDIIGALHVNLRLENHLGIKSITPDISVVTAGNRLVGVIEVKKPGNDILIQPTVMGELLDQLLLLEGFYESGPVIGILTSLQEWMFCWLPPDDACFENNDFQPSSIHHFTPEKSRKL
jgi:hypothetical protein